MISLKVPVKKGGALIPVSFLHPFLHCRSVLIIGPILKELFFAGAETYLVPNSELRSAGRLLVSPLILTGILSLVQIMLPLVAQKGC